MGIHHAHILGDIDLGLVNNAFWEIQQTTNHTNTCRKLICLLKGETLEGGHIQAFS